MKRLTKLFNISIKSVDEANRQVTFCFSDDQVDRMGEVVDQASWDVKNYMTNPVILWGHDPSKPENVLGQAVALDLNNNGKSYVTAQFDDAETNRNADTVFRQLVKRTLRCVSAGFMNHTFEVEEDTPVLKDNELLEISVVPIPANPRAVALALKEGSISTKDAKWLMDSMRKEADLLESQMKQAKQVNKENAMDKEQAQALIDGMAKLSEKVDTLTEDNKTLREELATLKPAEETEEEKKAREDKEAADKKAADEAEAARKAEAEGKTPPAKSGEGDQDGAGKDEFDENAELTPELQAEIDAEFVGANA